jgi:hypothetical protein
MWQSGRYDIEFVKEDGKWKYREFITLRGKEVQDASC